MGARLNEINLFAPGLAATPPRGLAPARAQARYTVEAASAQGRETAAAPEKYVVRPGDNLTRIVRRQMEATGARPSAQEVADAVRDVARANNLRNPNLIYPGDELDVSELASPAVGQHAPGAQASAPVEIVPPLVPRPDGAAPPAAPLRARASYQVAAAAPHFAAQRAQLTTPTAEPAAAPDTGPLHALRAGATQAAQQVVRGFQAVARVAPDDALADTGGPAGGPEAVASLERRGTRPPEGLTDAARIERFADPEVRAWLGDVLDRWEQEAQPGPAYAQIVRGDVRLSSDFGPRRDPFTGKRRIHEGIDLAAPTGTPVHPWQAGTVSYSGWMRGYGRIVIVDHDDGTQTRYAHNSANLVDRGDRVAPDTPLARVGSTGRSTGPHLHFELHRNGRPVNPLEVL